MPQVIVDASMPPASRSSRPFAFARHETFHIRDGWLAKALDALSQDGAALFGADAHHDLGVGLNMLKSIRYWVEATGLARPEMDPTVSTRRPATLELTELGQLVREQDPYMEDPATWWLLHGELASQERLATMWFWAFNICPVREFSPHQLEQGILRYVSERTQRVPTPGSLRKDTRCLVRTYAGGLTGSRRDAAYDTLGCPLTALGLMSSAVSTDTYRFVIGRHRSLPIELFLHFMYRFIKRAEADARVASFDDLRWAPLSPGRLLCLDSEAIRELVAEAQAEYGSETVREIKTAGLDQIVIDGRKPMEFIKEYWSVSGD